MGTSYEAGSQFAEDMAGDYTTVDINRFGAVWAGLDEFQENLKDLRGDMIEVDSVREYLSVIMEQFPEGFADSVKAFEDRHKK